MNKPLSATWFLFSIIALSLLLNACKSSKKVAVTEPKGNLDFKSARVLKEHLKKNEYKFDWLTAKLSVEAIIDSNDRSFGVSLRIRRDSILWLSITVPVIGEMARAIVTKDSVKFIDRYHSTYFAGDFNYISKLLNTDLDFDMIQSLMIGNSAAFYEEEDRLKSAIDGHRYLLSTVRKRRLRRVMGGNRELKEPVQSIWLEPELYKISRIFITEFNPARTFEARYSNFQRIDTLLFPFNANFAIKAEKNVSISIEYSKVTVNTTQSFPFNIPQKYERIVYKEK